MAKAPPSLPPAPDTPRRKRRTGVWVLATFGVMALLQFGPPLSIIIQRDLAQGFDWGGFIGFQLGSMFLPLVVGCLGLLFRPSPGAGFFVLSLTVFIFATLGSLV